MPESADRPGELSRRLMRVGARLVRDGLVHSCVGNISARQGDSVLISATGAMLDGIDRLVEIPADAHEIPPDASSDAALHLEIYRRTNAGAVVHTHSPYAVAVSIICEEDVLVTPDIEGARVLKGVPLLRCEEGGVFITRCADALAMHRAVILRGHGPIAIGTTVEEAFTVASFVEHGCRIYYMIRCCPPGEDRRPSADSVVRSGQPAPRAQPPFEAKERHQEDETSPDAP